MPSLRRDAWTLLATALAGSQPLSPVQLQKAVFLLQERLSDALPAPRHKFVPHNYGPFSSAVYDDARKLADQGLVRIDDTVPSRYVEYAATEEGLTKGQALVKRLPKADAEYARTLVEWVRSQTFAGLVSAIYSEYPQYRVNSIFRG